MYRLIYHNKPSYNIIYSIFNILYADHKGIIKILDLTYGVGRFYRIVRKKYNLFIIGVDIEKHEWETDPDIFINDTMFVVEKYIDINSIDLIIVDPPWDNIRRGYGKLVEIRKLQRYRTAYVDPRIMIYRALVLAKKYNKLILYKSPTIIRYSDLKELIIVENNINVFRKKGKNYYVVLG